MPHSLLSRPLLACLALLALLLTACTCDPEHAARAFAGTNARNCSSGPTDARIECVRAAQDANVPFFLVEQRQGGNSTLTLGFARNAAGESASFTHEAVGTSVGAGGGARVTMRSCERIGTGEGGGLTCVSPGAPVAVCR